MKKKKKETTYTGSVKVNPVALKEAKDLCEKTGVKISWYVTNAIINQNMVTEKNLNNNQ